MIVLEQKFYCQHTVADGSEHIQIREEILKFKWCYSAQAWHGGAVVGYRTCDQEVVGLIPSRVQLHTDSGQWCSNPLASMPTVCVTTVCMESLNWVPLPIPCTIFVLLIYWDTVLCPTCHRIGHFGDALSSRLLVSTVKVKCNATKATVHQNHNTQWTQKNKARFGCLYNLWPEP